MPQYRTTQLSRILRRIYFAIGGLFGMIALGTAGFYFGADPRPSVSDALHMTLITITTVGYSEVVPLNSFSERLFAGLLALAGFGTITFLFTTLTVFFLESDLDYTLRRRRMEKEIRKLRNHFIICGFGRVGRNVAQELDSTRRDFVAIDPDERMLESQSERFERLLYIAGDGSDDEVLLRADVRDARGVFAVTGDDSLNLMITLTARQLNPGARIVARCHELRNVAKIRKAGADSVISPDFTGGMRIASSMVRPNVVSFLDEMLRSEHKLRIEEIPLPDDFRPRTLGELRQNNGDFVLLAVRVGRDWKFNPPDAFELLPGQTLIVMTSPEGRAALELVAL